MHRGPQLVSLEGQTYTFRLQAIRATDTGSFLVAQTDVVTYLAP